MKTLALAGAALLLFGLSACSPNPFADTPSPSNSTAPDGNENAPCGGLTTADLATIFGQDLTGPTTGRGDSDQGGQSWTSASCDWENDAADLDVELDISVLADFADNTILCLAPEGSGTITAVEGIGTQAWWKVDDDTSDGVEGELRVCTADSLLELSVDTPAGTSTPDAVLAQAKKALTIVIG